MVASTSISERGRLREISRFNLSHQLDILTRISVCRGYLSVDWLIENQHTAAQFEELKRLGYIRVMKREDAYTQARRESGNPVVRVQIMHKKIAAGR